MHRTDTQRTAAPHRCGGPRGIQPFQVMQLLARARELERQGRDIVHMEIGEPDFPTPPAVLDAALRRLAGGDVHYTSAAGLPELREAIADHYRRRYGLDLPPRRIFLTAGASGALLLALGAVLKVGGSVLLADPGYPCNRNFVRFLGGEPVMVPVGADSRYQLKTEDIAAHWSSDMQAVIVASPSNPTGTLLSREALAALAAAAGERGGVLISDEIYHGLEYGEQAVSALEVDAGALVVNSFSKYFGMTGWRLGWLVVPGWLVETVECLAQNLFIAPSTPAQWAALAAFAPHNLVELERRRAEFQRRRDVLYDGLAALGFGLAAKPGGAFYLYADCSAHTNDAERFALALLEQAGVAVTPGRDFGIYCAESHLRFAYTTDVERLQTGLARLEQFLARTHTP